MVWVIGYYRVFTKDFENIPIRFLFYFGIEGIVLISIRVNISGEQAL